MLPLLLIPAALVAFNLLSVGSAAAKLLATVKGYKIRGGKLIILAQFTNPTRELLYVNYIFLDLLGNGTPVGQTRLENLKETFQIPGDTTKEFEIPFQVLYSSLITTILAHLATGGKAPDLQVKGYIRINEIRLPIEQTISLLA